MSKDLLKFRIYFTKDFIRKVFIVDILGTDPTIDYMRFLRQDKGIAYKSVHYDRGKEQWVSLSDACYPERVDIALQQCYPIHVLTDIEAQWSPHAFLDEIKRTIELEEIYELARESFQKDPRPV